MKYLLLILLLSSIYNPTKSQSVKYVTKKALPAIDSAAIVTWPFIGQYAISSNAQFFMYAIHNQPQGGQTLVIKSTKNEWEKRLINVPNGFFSPDNTRFFFQSNDSLYFLKLGKNEVSLVDKINSYSLSNIEKKEWLAYTPNNSKHDLVLQNLHSGKSLHFTNVTSYSFDPNGQTVLLQTQDTLEHKIKSMLTWVDLPRNKRKTIWSSTADSVLNNVVVHQFDETGRHLAFITTDTTLWYYTEGAEKAVVKLTNESTIKGTGLNIAMEPPSFSTDAQYLFFQLQSFPVPKRAPIPDAVRVDVWTYKDSILPFNQQPHSITQYKATMHIDSEKVIRIERDNEQMITMSNNGNYAIVNDRSKNTSKIEFWWPSSNDQNCWLVSLRDGSRKKMASIFDWNNYQFSPDSRYLVYFNYSSNQYCSYQLATGEKRNISGNINGACFRKIIDIYPFKVNPPALTEPVGWLPHTNNLLVYDNYYDIWQLDVTGQKPPKNLTTGLGRSEHIQFRIIYDYVNNGVIEGQSVLLSAFNTENKYTGIYKLSLKGSPKIEQLAMGPYTLAYMTKVPDKEAWLFQRETATEAPNYYISYDLKTYKPLSNLHPQSSYNWLTTELVTWKQLDGTFSQGVLYKPLNFDSTQKYPVIFQYYEKRSQYMYHFLLPEFATGEIDIPWYVSRGYLVFLPDIHYGVASVTGKVNGDYVVNSVVSAAMQLAKRPYVNADRMGVQGHSFGGGETLYLITHSNMFAAACAAAPSVSNEIAAYLGVTRPYGKPASTKITHSETGQHRIGATLWQRPDLYIKASPVFRADKVETPLLLMHNLGDPACEFNQSVEMFMGLRRLGKEVWLLQYDNGEHTVQGKDAVDYTKRMQQFFDHYLKGYATPIWMKKGVPADLKGIELGLELDTIPSLNVLR